MSASTDASPSISVHSITEELVAEIARSFTIGTDAEGYTVDRVGPREYVATLPKK